MRDVLRVLKFDAIPVLIIIAVVSATSLAGGRRQDPDSVWLAWILFAAMLLTVAHHARRAYVRATLRQRLASRHCPRCGYDLRASAGRCPECGRPWLRGSRRARGEP